MINFGKTIKTYRTKAGLTQADLARKIRVESTYISAIENGHKAPSLTLVKQIGKAVSVPSEVLFWESVQMDKRMPASERKVFDLAKTLVHRYTKAE